MGAEPGPLIGTGRAADVYDVGNGRVLRRYRDSIPALIAAEMVAKEAAVMGHVRAHGYPTPEVFDATGSDLVMERLDGVTMLTDLQSHPWRVDRHADSMVDLHQRLVAVPIGTLGARGSLVPTAFGPAEAIVHLDFHPDNVMLTAAGPVVFDWTNAVLGPAAADVAYAWVIGRRARSRDRGGCGSSVNACGAGSSTASSTAAAGPRRSSCCPRWAPTASPTATPSPRRRCG